MLEEIKLLMGITDTSKDKLINILINRAKEEITSYCHREPTNAMTGLISNMVIYQYNRIGSEGLSSEDYSNISYEYTDDYPESIIRQMNSYRKIRTI